MEQLTMSIEDYNALNHALPNTEIFSALTLPEIERVARTIHLCSFRRGEYVFKQGGRAEALYVVYEGTVGVCIKKHLFLPEKVIVTLGPNQVFGEMALLDRQPHCASIRAITPAKLFVILPSAFDILCHENPIFQNELGIISERRKFQNLYRD